MRNTLRATLIVASSLLLSGCNIYNTVYDMGLDQVERPAAANQRYGKQTIVKVNQDGKEKYVFEDKLVKIYWLPTTKGIDFSLENNTDHSIKIIWNEAAFVDIAGKSQRVMHAGVKFIDRNSDIPPSVVVRRGKFDDTVTPTESVFFVEGQYGGWNVAPFLPENTFYSDETAIAGHANDMKLVGKTFQVLLPLQIEDVVNEYIFTFKVNNTLVKDAQGKPPVPLTEEQIAHPYSAPTHP